MPTGCAVNRCTNNSNKGYAVFNFPSNADIREKWIAALGRNSDWQPTASQRICEVSNRNLSPSVFSCKKK